MRHGSRTRDVSPLEPDRWRVVRGEDVRDDAAVSCAEAARSDKTGRFRRRPSGSAVAEYC